jgi:hypothetical protein
MDEPVAPIARTSVNKKYVGAIPDRGIKKIVRKRPPRAKDLV